MKRILGLLFFGFLFLAAAVANGQTVPPQGINTGIQVNWTPPTGTACSATVTSSCIQGYTETITPPLGAPGGNVVIPNCNLAVTTGCIGAVSTYTWKPGGNLYCGNWGISLVVNWLNGSGVAVASTPLTGVTNEPCPFVASPATGMVAKPV